MQGIQAREEAHNYPTDVTPTAKHPGKSGKQVRDSNQLQAVDEEMPDMADNALHPDRATEPGSSSAVQHATASSLPTEHMVSTKEQNEPVQLFEGGAGMEISCMPADSMPMQREPQHQTEEEMPSNPKSANHWQTGKAAADSPVEVHGPPVEDIVHMDDEDDNFALQQEHNDAEKTSDKTTCEPIVEEHALDTFHDIGVKQAEGTASVTSPPCALPAPTVSPAADYQTTPTDLMPQPQQQHNLQQNLQQTASTPSLLPQPSEDMKVISKQALLQPDSAGTHTPSTSASFTFPPPAQPSRVQRPSAPLPVQPSTPVVATHRQPSPPPGHQIAMDKRQPNPLAGRQLDAMSVGAQKTGAAATSKSAPQQVMLQQPRYVQHITQPSALAKAKEILGRMPQVIRMPTPPRQVLSRSEQHSSPLTTAATRHTPALADMLSLVSTTAAGCRSQSPLAGNRLPSSTVTASPEPKDQMQVQRSNQALQSMRTSVAVAPALQLSPPALKGEAAGAQAQPSLRPSSVQVSVEQQPSNSIQQKEAGGPVHKPVAEAAADEEMLLEPDEHVAGRSFTSELIRGRIQLEKMMLETQKMMDEALELNVLTAISANRLVRLDNPIINAKLMALKREAEELFNSEE
ncbi:g9296 [Coccomyxa elongata]